MKRKCKTVFNTVEHWFHNYLALLAPTGVLYVVMHHYLSAPTFLDTQKKYIDGQSGMRTEIRGCTIGVDELCPKCKKSRKSKLVTSIPM